ncbi:zinc finger CONSTANS-like protein [Perilla frutescens var. frutescens]|nr:zinc finger CONSTANS-like protein [Perilla frutescens var. frutescens]
MAEARIQIEVEDSRSPHENAPLLKISDEIHQSDSPGVRENEKETLLDKSLQRLDLFLYLLGFNQCTVLSFLVSWGVFLVFGVLLPVVMLELSNCPGCEKGQIKSFEIGIVVSQASLAASALLCLSHNLRKYGVRKFLFVDRYNGYVERFSGQYVQKISDSVRLVVIWVFPCCLLKTAREIIRIMYVRHESGWQSAAILIAFAFSWTCVTTIILSACVLFHLVCNLQIIHFDDYGKLLERESDVVALLQEHARLRYNLSKISHRFRIYLLLQFVIVTVSQFMFLFQTTGYSGIITFINGGDFAVSSLVQVAVIILCLNAAAKISHRAQGIGALASRWHALVTCSANDASQLRNANSLGNSEAADKFGSLHVDYSESDLESLDFITAPNNVQLASYMSSYHKRLALVMYLQSNPGGITIFGWTVDRGLINTIFFIELSLVTFVLGKTIVITAE